MGRAMAISSNGKMKSRNAAAPRPNGGLLRYFKPVNVRAASSAASEGPVTLEAEDSTEKETRTDERDTTSNIADGAAENDALVTADAVTSEMSTLSEYERKRLARMAQNAQFLQQLGVKQAQNDVLSGSASAKRLTKPSKAAKRAREEDEWRVPATRRSRRLAGEKEASELKPKPHEGGDRSEEEADEMEPVYDDSSVLRYTCSGVSSHAADADSSASSGANRSLVGFRLAVSPALAYQDPNLKKIYAISLSPFPENALLASGGHQGHVSVYPAAPMATGGQDADATTPLMSFRAHRGWISCLSLQRSTANGKNLLLSAANDGVVKLWDLNQSAAGVPKELMVSNELHRSGIFGMDLCGDQVVTCSKDSTIVLSSFSDDGTALKIQRRYGDHEGVVKSVRFSSLKATVFASGGNDRVVRVYDSRSSGAAAAQEIHGAHSRAINSVNWHPTQEHLLLTASFDPEMHLYDLRQPSEPLVVMNTAQSFGGSGQSIFHPCFIAQGEFVVSTGATSQDKLSLHRTYDGTTVSVGELPSKASFLAVDPFADRLLVASSSSLESYEFQWQKAD